MGAKAFGVDLDLKEVDLEAGATRTPEFLKMNPLHTVPTLDDNGLYLADSRGVLQYFANAYGKDDTLYPKDPKKRAIVDQRFLFDLGTLYKAFADAYYPIFLAGKKPDPKDLEKFEEALGVLETYLSQTAYIAGDHFTIADFSIMATLVSADVAAGHNVNKRPNIAKYYEKCKGEIKDFSAINDEGMLGFKAYFKEALAKIN